MEGAIDIRLVLTLAGILFSIAGASAVASAVASHLRHAVLCKLFAVLCKPFAPCPVKPVRVQST